MTKKRATWLPLLLFCMLFGELLGNWATMIPPAYASPVQQLRSIPGHNTAQQFLNEGQPSVANQGQFKRPNDHSKDYHIDPNDPHNQPLPSSEPATMQDLTYTLDDSFVLHRPASRSSQQPAKVVGTAIPAGTSAFQIKGSDGRLEVDLARGSLDFAQARLADGSAPVGQLFLQLHQITGHFIEASSILGTYQIQIVDSLGNVVQGVVLIQPLTVIYHYQQWEMSDLNIDPGQVHLSWTTLLANAETARQPTTGLVMPMTNDATAQTLTAQSDVVGGVVALASTPTIATPSKPDLFEASGNNGQYSYSYPLTVVPGPGGFQPQLALSYNVKLCKADLSEASLSDAKLFEVDLSGADLRRADLRKADLGRANLTDALLCGALLEHITLAGAILERTDLRGIPWLLIMGYCQLGNRTEQCAKIAS